MNVEKSQEGIVLIPKITECTEDSLQDILSSSGDLFLHYLRQPRAFILGTETMSNTFVLKKKIGRFDYIISLEESNLHSGSGHYELTMKTQRYGFAKTNIGTDGMKILSKVLPGLVVAASGYGIVRVEQVIVDTVGTAYTADEIDDCIKKMLTHKNSTYTEEELYEYASKCNGVKIFEKYEELFGEWYHGEHPNMLRNDEVINRAQLFKRIFEEGLLGWSIVILNDSSFRLTH